MTGHPVGVDLVGALADLAVAAYCLVLLVMGQRTGRRAGWDVECSHLAMGVVMAGMFETNWDVGPNWLWELGFAALALWFVTRVARSIAAYGMHVPHTAVHVLMSAAMLLMFWFPGARGTRGPAMAMSMGMGATGGGLDPGVALVVIGGVLASAIVTLGPNGKGRAVYGSHGGAVVKVAWAPAWAVDGTHVVMCVSMALMLVLGI